MSLREASEMRVCGLQLHPPGERTMLSKIISMLTLIVLSVALGVLTLIHGWGLHPQNWYWIVGVGVGGQILVQIIMSAISGQK
jgi:hypothetical protein